MPHNITSNRSASSPVAHIRVVPMTIHGEVIWTRLVDNYLINVRAGLNGWWVSVIDTRQDRILRRQSFAQRSTAIAYASALCARGPRPDPMPDPTQLGY